MAEPTLHQTFSAIAAQHPNHVAVSIDGRVMTYGELERRSNQLANYLRRLRVGPESLVGLCTDRDTNMIVGMLGILKAGGAYVPIDPDYPASRLRFLVEDSAVTVLLTSGEAGQSVGDVGAPVLNLDSEARAIAGMSEDVPASGADASSAAYVIYTSGSTGLPKGVVVEHRNVLRLFSETRGWFEFGARDVWSMFHSFGFDFSVWEIWGALLHGGRLVIVPYETTRSPAEFRALVLREGVTMLSQTPSAFRVFVAADAGSPTVDRYALRFVVFGGEALDLQILRPWVQRHGIDQPRLINMYGITETTVHVTYRRLDASDIEATGRSPIGVPIPDLEVRLLDEAGQVVPDGTPGEIYVGGAGVARGYLRRPTLTGERFITDPLQPGKRLYRSGDRATRLPGGDLIYLGRSDAQLKVRGFRVEPGEIEAQLLAQADISAAVVVTRDYGEGDIRLVAYVVPQAGAALTDDLRAALTARLSAAASQSLPIHMRPSSYLVLAELPMTAHGKVDRAALPDPRQRSTQAAVAPTGESTSAAMTRIWQELLERDGGFGPQDDFFDVGGTSLTLIRMVKKVKARFGVDLDLSVLIDRTTIDGLSRYVQTALDNVS